MKKYFDIPYEFEKTVVLKTIANAIENQDSGYVCVADGVTLCMSQEYPLLKRVLDEAILVTCDSGWVPMYLKWIYGIEKEQYTGSQLFLDILNSKQYKMMFLGSSNSILKPLRENMAKIDPRILEMSFVSLPFRPVESFDYASISELINENNPDIIWVSLGMPKQEIFMHHLVPYLNRGVCIGVGAAFKFHSGVSVYKRAPNWIIKCKAEWVYRILQEPKKQIGRCFLILKTIPGLLYRENKKRKNYGAFHF